MGTGMKYDIRNVSAQKFADRNIAAYGDKGVSLNDLLYRCMYQSSSFIHGIGKIGKRTP
jgi:hypothetical protein